MKETILQKKTIIYIGKFTFPIMDAQSKLVFYNGILFNDLGYRVIYIGKTTEHITDSTINVSFYKGKKFYAIPFSKKASDIKRFIKIKNEVINILQEYQYDLHSVIFYGSPTFSLLISKIRTWTELNKIPLVGSVADIPTLTHGSVIERIFKWMDQNILRYNIKYGTTAIITVSSFIQKYFGDNKQCVILPPLVDTSTIEKHSNGKSEKINILYAGIPFPVDGRKVDISSYKDRLDITIDLLSVVYKTNQNFVLNIFGLTSEEYLRVVGRHKNLLSEMSAVICFHGETAHEDIVKLVSQADFTINLRDVNRMTTAGFSTKFVESISCGTPVITTQTSDLGDYLVEGKNGYFININNKEEAVSKLITILSSTKENISVMKDYTYNSKLFDYRNHTKSMRNFLECL